MRSFATLLWLEYRRSRVWAAALLGSLVFWFWGLNQVTVTDVGERAGIRVAILGVAAAVGLVVLCFMIGRIRGETRRGQYQILLLTPPSGYLHVLARFLFALGVGIVYYVIIGGLLWWVTLQAGIHPDAGSILQLLLAGPFYGIGAVLVPFLVWTLLLMVFSSAYRLSGPNWTRDRDGRRNALPLPLDRGRDPQCVLLSSYMENVRGPNRTGGTILPRGDRDHGKWRSCCSRASVDHARLERSYVDHRRSDLAGGGGMTQAFLIVLRLLCLGLLGYFAYRLWTGTRSFTTRGVAGLFLGALAWQIIAGTW